MPALELQDIADLYNSTDNFKDRKKFTDLTTDTQKFVALPRLEKSSEEQSGVRIDVRLLDTCNDQSIWRGMDDVDSYTIKDGLRVGQLDWRHANWNWTMDEREIASNQGAEEILNLLKVREHQAWMKAAHDFETAFWGKPAAGSSDLKTFYGIDNYVVRNATEGFNGGNPTGYTTGCIFDSTARLRWKNFTNQYTNTTKPDLVRKIRRAQMQTGFESPHDTAEARKIGFKCELYTNLDVKTELEELVEQQNENLGMDLAKYDDMVLIGKCPVKWAPQLDSDTQDPVYGVNWDAFGYVFQKGRKTKVSKARIHPDDHLKMVVDVDLSGNVICRNRRSLFIINKA